MNNSQKPALLNVLQKPVLLKNLQNEHVVLNIKSSKPTLARKTKILIFTILCIPATLTGAALGIAMNGGGK